jgi:hypothetical protein
MHYQGPVTNPGQMAGPEPPRPNLIDRAIADKLHSWISARPVPRGRGGLSPPRPRQGPESGSLCRGFRWTSALIARPRFWAEFPTVRGNGDKRVVKVSCSGKRGAATPGLLKICASARRHFPQLMSFGGGGRGGP